MSTADHRFCTEGLGDDGIPFRIPEYAEDGDVFSEWDGTTLALSPLLGYYVPSKTSDSVVTVYGPGSDFCIPLTECDLIFFYWRIKKTEIKFAYPETWEASGSASADGGKYTGDGPDPEDYEWVPSSASVSISQSLPLPDFDPTIEGYTFRVNVEEERPYIQYERFLRAQKITTLFDLDDNQNPSEEFLQSIMVPNSEVDGNSTDGALCSSELTIRMQYPKRSDFALNSWNDEGLIIKAPNGMYWYAPFAPLTQGGLEPLAVYTQVESFAQARLQNGTAPSTVVVDSYRLLARQYTYGFINDPSDTIILVPVVLRWHHKDITGEIRMAVSETSDEIDDDAAVSTAASVDATTPVRIIFEAVEYWPYAKPNGAPLFNTTTGVEIP